MLAFACAVTVIASLTGCTGSNQPGTPGAASSRTTPTQSKFKAGPLTRHEFALAVAIARHEASKKTTRSITSATATRTPGAEVLDNAGRPCTFRTVLNIKLIGTFNLVHGVARLPVGYSTIPTDDEVHAVLISVDARSGAPCQTGVAWGDVSPDPSATVLFTA